jgi:anti-sigma B factor antagonist
MAINFEDINDHFRRIMISGRMDIPGTAEIEMKFTALTATAAHQIVVDLTRVEFLASIGIRALISNAKALQRRGGRLVLFVGDNAAVSKTLEAAGIDDLLPMFRDAAEADRAAAAP